MARLSQAPDSLYTTPLSSRNPKPVEGDQPNMPFPVPLRPLSLDTSLQSHGSDNLPDSPPRRAFNRPLLSPADYRTLGKILRDVASSPVTPSPLEQSDQLFPDGGRAGTTGTADEEDGCHFIGGEATDTGYEDEDENMELSEGGEIVTDQVVTSLEEPASPSVSKSERRLQESVSAHDKKEKARYSSGRRSMTNRGTKVRRKEHTTSRDAAARDTIDNIMNLPGKCAPRARSLGVGQAGADRQAVPDDIKQLVRARLGLEKVLEQEHLEQERAEGEEEPGVFVSTIPEPQDQAQVGGGSELDGFAADDEQTQPRFSLGFSSAPRCKVSYGSASKSTDQHTPLAPRNETETPVQVPSTPTPTPANQTPEPAHIQSATNQVVPETPFTKTLRFFKQHKGVENSPPACNRNTALPQELAEVAEDVAEVAAQTKNMQHGIAQPKVEIAATRTSAVEDLKAMVQPSKNTEADGAALQREYDYVQVDSIEELATDEGDVAAESAISDDQKQMILYPQNPAFINAIGMIPATMFWATAAPVVKYTGLAVDLLIDQLRDTFLLGSE